MWEGVYLQFPIFNISAQQSKAAWRCASRRTPKKRVPFWSAPAERSDDGALDGEQKREMGMAGVGRRLSPIPHLQSLRSAIQSGVALRFPPHSKKVKTNY